MEKKTDLLTAERYHFKPDWTIGRTYIYDQLFGFVLEDEIRVTKVKGETAIWYGRYPLGLRVSPKFSRWFLWSDKAGRLIPNPACNKNFNNKSEYNALYNKYDDWKEHLLIWIMNVDQFEYVLIHWGNVDRETDACLLVGAGLGIIGGREAVTFSQIHYMDLYEKVFPIIRKGNQFINITKAA